MDENTQIKADSLYFKFVVIVSFQTKSSRVQNQNNKKCVPVQLIIVLPVNRIFMYSCNPL